MQDMVQTIRHIARHEVRQTWLPRLAVVTSVSPASEGDLYACSVQLREEGIVLPRVPVATSLLGLTALPRQDDLVLVAFANGDIHAPVIVGCLYNEQAGPPEHGPGELALSLPGGETSPDKRIELRIKASADGGRSLRLLLDGDVKVELEVTDEGLVLQAQEARLSLRQTGASDGVAELSVSGSRVKIEQSGNVSIEAEGTLSLKATNIEISGDASVKIAGQTIDLN